MNSMLPFLHALLLDVCDGRHDPLYILTVGHAAPTTMMWCLDNLHPKTQIECIIDGDKPDNENGDNWLSSSPISGPFMPHQDRVLVHRGDPRIVLRSMEFGPGRFGRFDVVMLHHDSHLQHAILTFDLLKRGGVLVAEASREEGGNDDFHLIDAFMTAFVDRIHVIHRDATKCIFAKIK